MDNKYYGIYRGICIDIEDPEQLNRIRLKVPQVLNTNVTNWAYPCLPVATNADHPDHLNHTAAQVAALLSDHVVSGSTSVESSPGSHSHTFSVTKTHSGKSGQKLNHDHATLDDPLETNDTEHTLHRKIPNLNQGVWVMFEGGDINFPVWIGVY